jgi:ferredoxin-thioredoxin reductase catalytic subunit/rubredoxin
MTDRLEVTPEEVEQVYEQLKNEAEAGGYHLNPDEEFTKDLVWGLLTCEKRYGYRACPCRLASGVKDQDLDIICPCDYRDPDLDEHGCCYCALYVTQEVLDGKRELSSIPDRRAAGEGRQKTEANAPGSAAGISSLPLPVWRCKVCGYLCAREGPPEVCPVCKAKKERFERFM